MIHKMEAIFTWCAEHSVLCTTAGVILAFLLGSKKVREKMKMFGFTLSQGVRKTLGRKFEELIEEGIIGSLYRGMRSDNKKDKE